MYYTYMLRCEDGSIYTGIAKDINKRMIEHFSQDKKCAKYTKRHKPLALVKVWKSENRALASKLEYHIKKNLDKSKKEDLIINDILLEEYLGDRIRATDYCNIDLKKF